MQQRKKQPLVVITFNHYVNRQYSKDTIQGLFHCVHIIGNHHIEALNLKLKHSCKAHLKPLYWGFKPWDEPLCRLHMQPYCRSHLKPSYWRFKPRDEPLCRVHMQPSCRAHQKHHIQVLNLDMNRYVELISNNVVDVLKPQLETSQRVLVDRLPRVQGFESESTMWTVVGRL